MHTQFFFMRVFIINSSFVFQTDTRFVLDALKVEKEPVATSMTVHNYA